ncbi:MAG: alpha/beta fold hydrolase [Anaerolineae bacterium]
MKKKTQRWLAYGLLGGVTASLVSEALRAARRRRYALAHHVNRETWDALKDLPVAARSDFVSTDKVRLHTVIAGPEEGPLAVLLHGFPENWYSWRHQIPMLVKAGYRVVAPDQRGYNLSEKPPGASAYRMENLEADVVGLIRAFDRERATIIGHDWGGVVAWRLAMDYPEMVERLVILNAPHPEAFARELRQNWKQRLRSWYALAFQIPWLPEKMLAFSPRATARHLFGTTAVREGAFSSEDLDLMATALAQPGAMQAMINWYRAALRYRSVNTVRSIECPTLLLWGEDDVALGKELTYDLTKWVPKIEVSHVLHCGHWIQNEAPDEVNARLMAFLNPGGS